MKQEDYTISLTYANGEHINSFYAVAGSPAPDRGELITFDKRQYRVLERSWEYAQPQTGGAYRAILRLVVDDTN